MAHFSKYEYFTNVEMMTFCTSLTKRVCIVLPIVQSKEKSIFIEILWLRTLLILFSHSQNSYHTHHQCPPLSPKDPNISLDQLSPPHTLSCVDQFSRYVALDLCCY